MTLWRRIKGIIWHYRAMRAFDVLARHEPGTPEWDRAALRVERLYLL